MKLEIARHSLLIRMQDNHGYIGDKDHRDTAFIEDTMKITKGKTAICKRCEDQFGNLIYLELQPND